MAVQRITEAVTHDRAVTIMVDSDSEIADTHLKHVLWCLECVTGVAKQHY